MNIYKYNELDESFFSKIEFESILIKTKEEAQNAPCAWTNYALFYNGKYITNEILSENKFLKLVEELGVNNV